MRSEPLPVLSSLRHRQQPAVVDRYIARIITGTDAPPKHDPMNRMALQALVRPASRPVVADMLSRTRGSIWTDDPDSLIMVSHRWFVSPLQQSLA